MEELHKKIIGNAVSAYFMVFVSIFFLLSKKPYINHPFVKSHVKSAFSLHVLMFIMLFFMSYPFLRSIDIFGYSLNTIITASLSLFIFTGILYGMYMAHKGKTVTLGEIFHRVGVPKDFISHTQSQKVSEENSLTLILAHIPFLGYIIYPRQKNLAHMRDISQLNFIVTLLSVLIFIVGHTSLASFIMLIYIIYSVYQGIRLSIQDEITTLNLDIIPTIEEKYILQKSLFTYVGNNLRKKSFIPLSQIIAEKTQLTQNQENENEKSLAGKKYSFHTKNNITLAVLFLIAVFLLGWDSPILILFLFPACYALGYVSRKAYRMPYIYDIYALLSTILSHAGNILHATRKLQKTQVQETIKMGENKSQEETKK